MHFKMLYFSAQYNIYKKSTPHISELYKGSTLQPCWKIPDIKLSFPFSQQIHNTYNTYTEISKIFVWPFLKTELICGFHKNENSRKKKFLLFFPLQYYRGSLFICWKQTKQRTSWLQTITMLLIWSIICLKLLQPVFFLNHLEKLISCLFFFLLKTLAFETFIQIL